MKVCTKCKQEKALNEFNFKNRIKLIYSSHCRECTKLYVKNHYLKNKNYYLLKARKRNLILRQLAQEFIIDYLSKHPCVDCREKDILVLEFDHRDNKIISIAEMVRGYYSINKIIEEISKCDVRCANCHRRRTAVQFGWFKSKNASIA